MKTIAGLVLLALLLYNMLGLSIAVLTLENDFQTQDVSGQTGAVRVIKQAFASQAEASAPFPNEGLYRVDDQLYNVVRQFYAHDTLYVMMQANASAWQRFSELSEMLQELNSNKHATTPHSKIIRLLNDLTKIYLSAEETFSVVENESFDFGTKPSYAELEHLLISQISRLSSPPPERV